MRVIVGLGNPGREYVRTPHNVGFEVADRLAKRLDGVIRRSWRFRARTAKVGWKDESLLLVQPQSYMNNSGAAIAPILRTKGAGPEQLIVVLDDADLPIGRLRIRSKGGSGGHKGLASIITAVGSEEFTRVRIGVGRSTGKDLVDHVLTPFSPEEWKQMEEILDQAAEAVLQIVDEGVERAMNRFNG